MSKHRVEAKCRAKFRLHQEMNRIGCDAFRIELVEQHPCSCANELHKREGEIIRELNATLNIYVAGRSYKEYAEEHKDKIETYKKQWYEANKERLSAECKKRYDENPEKHKERAKQWNKEHPEITKQRKQEHYERNKEQILNQQKQFRLDNLEMMKEKEKPTNEININM